MFRFEPVGKYLVNICGTLSCALMGAHDLMHRAEEKLGIKAGATTSDGMFTLAHAYKDRGMAAYSELQQAEFAAEPIGYTATKHQREVGTGYFDAVSLAISSGQSSTTALKDSTEADQFH